MTPTEINIAKALLTAKEILTKMLAQGIGSPKHVYGLSSVLVKTYNLDRDQSLIIIEEALKIA